MSPLINSSNMKFTTVFYLFIFEVSLASIGWPPTPFVAEADLKFFLPQAHKFWDSRSAPDLILDNQFEVYSLPEGLICHSWWCAIISDVGKLRREDFHEYEANLGYVVKFRVNKIHSMRCCYCCCCCW